MLCSITGGLFNPVGRALTLVEHKLTVVLGNHTSTMAYWRCRFSSCCPSGHRTVGRRHPWSGSRCSINALWRCREYHHNSGSICERRSRSIHGSVSLRVFEAAQLLKDIKVPDCCACLFGAHVGGVSQMIRSPTNADCNSVRSTRLLLSL